MNTGKPLWDPNVWKLKRQDIRNIKLCVLLGLITIDGIAEAYVRIPQQIIYGSQPTPISDRKGAESVVIIFPGAGGVDTNIENLSAKIEISDKETGKTRFVRIYDWTNWRNDFIRIAFDGQAVGKKVCSNLAEEERESGKPIKDLHAIGISVGAFAADSCIKAYNQYNQNNIEKSTPVATTRLTLLDPFTSKGVFGYGWGIKNFGKTADLAINYLNSDDQVPTTNNPLNLAYNYDITTSKSKADYILRPGENYHSWPVAFLVSNWRIDHTCIEPSPGLVGDTSTTSEETMLKFQPVGLPQSSRPRGAVCKVP